MSEHHPKKRTVKDQKHEIEKGKTRLEKKAGHDERREEDLGGKDFRDQRAEGSDEAGFSFDRRHGADDGRVGIRNERDFTIKNERDFGTEGEG